MNNSCKQKGFSVFEIVLVAALVVVIGAAGYFAYSHYSHPSKAPGATATVIKDGEIRLSGKITKDTCFTRGAGGPPIGDVGCSITVNGYQVSVRHGNTRPPKDPGTITGLDSSRDQVGDEADVYAQLLDGHTVSIWDASKYYVRITHM